MLIMHNGQSKSELAFADFAVDYCEETRGCFPGYKNSRMRNWRSINESLEKFDIKTTMDKDDDFQEV